eukprot:jgi/Hompol1/1674/HPOL_002487-RA
MLADNATDGIGAIEEQVEETETETLSSLKESEKRLETSLGISDDQQAPVTGAVGKKGGLKGKAGAGPIASGAGVVATGKKGAAGAQIKRATGGKGAATRRGNKKGASQQAAQSSLETNARAAIVADTITENGEEEEASPDDRKNEKQDPHSNKEQAMLVEIEEDQDWESDLDVDEIINRKSAQDPYIHACKTLGIVPVSYIIERISQPEIIMPHHGLGVRGAQALARILEGNTALTRLDLSSNCIEAGGVYIGQSLQSNRTLTYLNLSDNWLGNKFGDREATLIADGLKQNSTIEIFDLSRNEIGDLGAIALGSAIAKNEALRDVNVSWNQIRSRGMGALLNGAKENTSIVCLSVQYNGIGENGAAVSQMLSRNTTLTYFNMGSVEFVLCSILYTLVVYGVQLLTISE